MGDIRRQPKPSELGGLFAPVVETAKPTVFATDDPPRATARQRTRWATQDAAYASRPDGIVARVLDSLRTEPATCDELEQRLELTHQTCSAAVNLAMRRGWIYAEGSRPTRSGRAARIWKVRA